MEKTILVSQTTKLRTLEGLSYNLLPIWRKLRFRMKKYTFGLWLIALIIMGGYLINKKNEYIFDNVPCSFIGNDSLENIKKYLIIFLGINTGTAIIICVCLFLLFLLFGIFSKREENVKKINAKRIIISLVVSIAFSFILCFSTLSGSNHLDVQCLILGKSDNSILKSFQLLNDINSDIKSQKTRTLNIGVVDIDEVLYEYKSGKFNSEETEYLLKSDKGYEISQLSAIDCYELIENLSKSDNVSCES